MIPATIAAVVGAWTVVAALSASPLVLIVVAGVGIAVIADDMREAS